MSEGRSVDLKVPILARVEGEGALELEIRGDRLERIAFRIYEPPRLFEKFLEGRGFDEVPDIVARICGICPVAYQMSAVHAIESLFGCDPGPWVRELRRLLYCGEWIESHALHVHLLAAPDFFGHTSVAELAREHPEPVRRGLALQALGNEIIRLLGGRSVHPVGVKVGGFHRAPERRQVAELLQKVRRALPEAEAMVLWLAELELPSEPHDFEQVALSHPGEYAMNEGRIRSAGGLDIASDQFQEHFQEAQVPHSTAFHCHLDGVSYLVGPLARINLNRERLPGPVRELMARTGIDWPSRDMFHSAVARALEIFYALVEAERILAAYRPDSPAVEVTPRPGVGYGATEAPRGLLWHCYAFDEQGKVARAVIVPPTSQNQARIEADLRRSLEAFGLDRPDDQLLRHAERVVRNYDPCISCSTHFLRLDVRRL